MDFFYSFKFCVQYVCTVSKLTAHPLPPLPSQEHPLSSPSNPEVSGIYLIGTEAATTISETLFGKK